MTSELRWSGKFWVWPLESDSAASRHPEQGRIECNDTLRPGWCISDSLEIQYNFNGDREKICVDLLLFINRHFCRVRHYKNTFRHVGTAVHLAYWSQNKNFGMEEHFGDSGGGGEMSMTFAWLSTSQVHRHPASHSGNCALAYKMGLEWAQMHIWYQLFSSTSKLKAYFGVKNVGEDIGSSVLTFFLVFQDACFQYQRHIGSPYYIRLEKAHQHSHLLRYLSQHIWIRSIFE